MSTAKKGNNFKRKLFSILISVVCCFAYFAVIPEGAENVTLVCIAVTIIASIVISGCIKRNQKKVALVAVCEYVFFFLISVCAVNDIPSFIREIQGEDFIGIFLGLIAVGFLIQFLISFTYARVSSKSKISEALSKKYTDNDLMGIQGFSQSRVNGYYLLKAKLYNVIKYTSVKPDENAVSVYYIDINENMPVNVREKICANNPQVKRIVEYILKVKEKAKKEGQNTETSFPVDFFVKNLNCKIDETTEGMKFYKESLESIGKVRRIGLTVFFNLVLSVGFSKLFMGLTNAKPVGIIAGMMFMLAMLSFVFIPIQAAMGENQVKNKIVKKIVEEKQKGFKNIKYIFMAKETERPNLSRGEIEFILNAYALYKYENEEYSVKNANFVQPETFSGIIFTAASMIEIAKNKDTDGGGCGCGGCGGCGGGCGGCGGCGD